MANAKVHAVITADASQATGAIRGVSGQLQALAGIAAGGLGLKSLASALSGVVTASNKMENALIGLTSMSNAFGQDTAAATQAARELASDGLMTIGEAAAGLKNLLATGFGLDQAVVLMNRFKDTAAFGRQAALGFGESIVGATEGVKNGNSVLSDNAGVTRNLSLMLEDAGLSAQDLMKASTDTTVRMALLNGVIKESAPMLGNAARLSETFSGAQSRLGTQVTYAKAKLGDMLKSGLAPLLSRVTDFVTTNQALIVSLAMAAAAVVGFVSTLAAGAGLIATIGTAVAALGGPLTIALLLISALMGAVVFKAAQKLQTQMANTAKNFGSGAGAIKRSADSGLGKAAEKAKELAEKLADIDEQMAKTTRNFREQLAEIVQDHRQKVTDLEKQLARENKDFDDTQTEKAQEFKDSQQEMVREHERRVAQIKAQINAELIAHSDATGAKLNELRVSLAAENEDYNRQFASNAQKYEQDKQKAIQGHEEKRSDLQIKLDEEKAFLEKHNADISMIRDVQLLDEIDKLKRSHVEQMAEFDKQKVRAVESARKTTEGMAGAFNSLPGLVNTNALAGPGAELGRNMFAGFKSAIKQAFLDFSGNLVANIIQLAKRAGAGLKAALTLKGEDGIKKAIEAIPLVGFAAGGYVSGSQPVIVGERGPELFMPSQSGTIIPNDKLGTRASTNITNNLSVNVGTFVGTEMEKRKLAEELFRAYSDLQGARGMA